MEFRHVDAERTIVFGPGALAAADDLLGSGYTLLTTARARARTPQLADRASAVIDVPDGLVEAVAAELRGNVDGARLVAVGGGRVIDVAKALAAADGPRDVVAVPTSLSAAEMTAVHRHATGVPAETPRVRPARGRQRPGAERVAAAAAAGREHRQRARARDRRAPQRPLDADRAGGGAGRDRLSRRRLDAIRADCRRRCAARARRARPVRACPRRAACRLGGRPQRAGPAPCARADGGAHRGDRARARERRAAAGHDRRGAAAPPAELERVDAALGTPLEAFAETLRERAGAHTLGDPALLDRLVDRAAERAELDRISPRPDRDEIRAIYLTAARPAAPAS